MEFSMVKQHRYIGNVIYFFWSSVYNCGIHSICGVTGGEMIDGIDDISGNVIFTVVCS